MHYSIGSEFVVLFDWHSHLAAPFIIARIGTRLEVSQFSIQEIRRVSQVRENIGRRVFRHLKRANCFVGRRVRALLDFVHTFHDKLQKKCKTQL